MLNEWLFIGIFLVIGIVFPGAPIFFTRFLAPHKPNPAKLETYECGMETVGDTWV
ncbi:MAG: NADH-quinone oxidoreductase subunit A, partial [Chloroflexi bacterium]|nr:NADH-quinone oxidoreductase subunit A [Chloroflexota bacterium]